MAAQPVWNSTTSPSERDALGLGYGVDLHAVEGVPAATGFA